jgi:hypothetical protein
MADGRWRRVPYDLYVWQSPRDVDDQRASALVHAWEAEGEDPATAPFEPSTDIGWFHRELVNDRTGLELVSDANPTPSTKPVWLSGGDVEPAARVVAIRITPGATSDDIDDVFSLATKYDLVLFDARSGSVHFPLQEMADYADATFWPGGAIQAAFAGLFGLLIAIAAWIVGIPILSGIVIVIGGFMFVMAVFTFAHAGRKWFGSRRTDSNAPPG